MEKLTLSNGAKLKLDPNNHEQAYNDFIDLFFKPGYIKSNDITKTISASIKEVERISSIFNLSKGEVITSLLQTIERRLPKDIAELTGEVDKIEILFENMDDYQMQILDLIKENNSPEKIRLEVSQLVENLNLFEISELLIHLAKKIK
ncbi:hypothetical protein NEF87_004478 [Candidatus Lokiarchaeum ossiferum]|uniref:Uncharacterized protein n=1 Tax=Candidatus Lokiarchaeum ossiferum TaxID=2951803 RepID=A0ABY6HXD9_9ARCH|nr:hypothetical protein NEF87_004478 [Candidatus Lokiarchaeum sp. B-35]